MTPDQIGGAAFLFLLMWIVGMELTVADFRRVLATPRSVVGGTIAQLLLLPAMTWGVCTILDTPPAIAAGAILVAGAPGAGMSNLMAALAGANTALSVSLTATASVLAVVTLPILASAGVRLFGAGAGSAEVDVPVAPLMLQLFFSLLLPIGLGMWFRARWPDFVKRHAGRMQRAFFGLMALFIVAAVATSDDPGVSLADAPQALLLAVVWTGMGMAIGYGVALVLRLSPADRLTYLIEFSARNIAVSSIVALSGLARVDLAIFSGAYGAVGYPMVVAATLIGRRALQRSRAGET